MIPNIAIVKIALKSFPVYLPEDASEKMDNRECSCPSWGQGMSKQLQEQPLSNTWSVLSQNSILQLKF